MPGFMSHRSASRRIGAGAFADILKLTDDAFARQVVYDEYKQAGASPNVGFVLPVLFVIILAVVATGLSPASAQLCSTLEDFPCGP